MLIFSTLALVLLSTIYDGSCQGRGRTDKGAKYSRRGTTNPKKFPKIKAPTVPYGNEILEKLDKINNKGLAQGMAIINGAMAYRNGYLRIVAIGEAIDAYKEGGPDAALRPIFEATAMLVVYDFYQVTTTSRDVFNAIKEHGDEMSSEVGEVLKKSSKKPAQNAYKIGVSVKKAVTNKVASVLADGTKLGKVVSAVLNFGTKVVNGMKWLCRYFAIPVVSDLLNIAVTFQSLTRAYRATPRDNDQIAIDLIGIAASAVSLGVTVAGLWGPVGWVVAGALSAISMMLAFMKPPMKPAPRNVPKVEDTVLPLLQDTIAIETLRSLGDHYEFLGQQLTTDYVIFDFIFVANIILTNDLLNGESNTIDRHPTLEFSLLPDTWGSIGRSYNHYERNKYAKFTQELLYSGPKNRYIEDLKEKSKKKPTAITKSSDADVKNIAAAKYLPYGFLGLKRNDTFQGRTAVFIDDTNQFYGASINTDISKQKLHEFDRSYDDVTIGDIASMPGDKQIILNLGLGVDAVNVKGRLGELTASAGIKLKVAFENENNNDPDDTISFKQLDDAGGRSKITGLEIFKEVKETAGTKYHVCYILNEGSPSCQIELDILPRTLVSSKLADTVYLNADAPIMVYNCEGENTYDVSITRSGRDSTDTKYQYFINDIAPNNLPKLKIKHPDGSYIMYRERTQSIIVYEKDPAPQNPGYYYQLLEIHFMANVSTNVDFGGRDLEISSLPTVPEGMPPYRYVAVKYRKKFACFCNRKLVNEVRLHREYFGSFGMGPTFDLLIMERELIQDTEIDGVKYIHNATLVWEKVIEDSKADADYKIKNDENPGYYWVLQYRSQKESDPFGISRRPHYDVILKYIEVFRFDGPNSKVLDLTDKDSGFGGVIDLKIWDQRKYDKFVLGGEAQSVPEATANSDYLDIKIYTGEGGSWENQGEIDMGEGADTLILGYYNLKVITEDTNTNNLNLHYSIFNETTTVEEHPIAVMGVRFYKNGDHQSGEKILEIRNVGRLACRFKEIMRTAKLWDKLMSDPAVEFDAPSEQSLPLKQDICPDMYDIPDFFDNKPMHIKTIDTPDEFWHGTKCQDRTQHCYPPFW